MRKPILIANWKMNGSLHANQALLVRLLTKIRPYRKAMDMAVCPPFPYLFQVRDLLGYTGLALGAQNASPAASGAHTGEVSATMLREMGCRYVLIGHSERRSMYHESSDDVAARFRQVRSAGMTPILCVGETLEEREQGRAMAAIEMQLQTVIDENGMAGLRDGIIAYEPVWAIGTGRTASPAQVSETHRAVRQFLEFQEAGGGEALRIVYGGSVKAGNAAELFQLPDVDGGLIGGASLQADEFADIASALAVTTAETDSDCVL
ncbi:triose-phosphate isomerase [Marinobacter vulgaris]|uniref:Triosephosphate isomerase n=1 Tax=Marinobacter vulgaris TaxID=1928331 RepID=A0A2V3ZKD4_9GAMM|nr:triose-phosphate isomerase [Marinobacter vulgaris]PXX90890.1 triose-phosphate isomerase [Marinobacter vulgaris]TSJ70132.1 triose-phosphate isomerase [Marinobacter vulgaris]